MCLYWRDRKSIQKILELKNLNKHHPLLGGVFRWEEPPLEVVAAGQWVACHRKHQMTELVSTKK
jgi:hypothetical protein